MGFIRKKRLYLIILSALSFAQLNAQEGIEFGHDNFDEALNLAKDKEKLIFVDFYTDWCGPCKTMSKFVFTDNNVGAYFNQYFVSVKANAEKGSKEIAKKYNVDSYPTLIFLNTDGEVVLKKSGAVTIQKFLDYGKEAVSSALNNESLADFTTSYPARKDDQEFLLAYINKLLESNEPSGLIIDEWLNIQNTVKEDDVDMMEFLMDHSKDVLAGGKTEEVFYTNFDEYWDIATRAEEKKLIALKRSFVTNTWNYAIRTNNVEMFELAMDKWKALPKELQYEKPVNIKLVYYELKKDGEAYKELAGNYLDSAIKAESIEDMKRKDEADYIAFCKKHENDYSISAENNKEKVKVKRVNSLTKEIVRKGNVYLRFSDKKSDYKHLYKWISYGKKLMPDDYRMTNLEAMVKYKEGKIDDAISLKEKAASMIRQDDKRYLPQITDELRKMKKGELVI